jgi:hypothetical protein
MTKQVIPGYIYRRNDVHRTGKNPEVVAGDLVVALDQTPKHTFAYDEEVASVHVLTGKKAGETKVLWSSTLDQIWPVLPAVTVTIDGKQIVLSMDEALTLKEALSHI